MAEYTFPAGSIETTFPIGTTVTVYEAQCRHPEGRAPITGSGGGPLTSAVVDAQGLTFTGLEAKPYVAYALVGGAHRYMRFRAGSPPSYSDLSVGWRMERHLRMRGAGTITG